MQIWGLQERKRKRKEFKAAEGGDKKENMLIQGVEVRKKYSELGGERDRMLF